MPDNYKLPSVYRGTRAYALVYCELLQVARSRGLTTYQRLAELIGLEDQGNYMGSEIGQVLGEISEDEQLRDRPMLSAVAVGVSNAPGDGFFTCAEELDRQSGETREARNRFWKSERDAVYLAWQWVPFKQRRQDLDPRS